MRSSALKGIEVNSGSLSTSVSQCWIGMSLSRSSTEATVSMGSTLMRLHFGVDSALFLHL